MDRFDQDLDAATDEDLLGRFLDGEETAFSVLMRRHQDAIFVMAYRITGDRGEALDATQEAFVSLFRRAASFRGESAFRTWLYRIGINAAYDMIRRRRPTEELSEQDAELGHTGERMENAASIRSDIAGALAKLPAEYREAVVMHDLGDIPYEEIARLTNVSLGTVKSRISRGRKRLAEVLEPSYGPRTSKDQ